jgi:hypothetical protein
MLFDVVSDSGPVKAEFPGNTCQFLSCCNPFGQERLKGLTQSGLNELALMTWHRISPIFP